MKITSIQQLRIGYAIGTSDGKTETIKSYSENPNPGQPWPPELGGDFGVIEEKPPVVKVKTPTT
jgi:hypothetical protein